MVNIKDIFSLILSIVGITLVLFLTYYSTKWLSTKSNLAIKSKYMSIVDKVMVGQNKYLAIAKICNKYYLMSITEKDINIIKELEDFQTLPDIERENSMEFKNMLNKFIKNK